MLSQLVYIQQGTEHSVTLLLTNMPTSIANSIIILRLHTISFRITNAFSLVHAKITSSRKIQITTYDYKRADFEGNDRALETFLVLIDDTDSTSDINDDWYLLERYHFLNNCEHLSSEKTIKRKL